MSPPIHSNQLRAKKWSLLFLLLFSAVDGISQKSKADSLEALLLDTKNDTSRVMLMCQLANAVNIYNPDTAITLAQQAIYLSKEIKFQKGQSKSLGTMANAVIKTGNNPRALDLYFQKLQLDEKLNIPREQASVLMNIGIVYTMQEEYNKALEYYSRANTVIRGNNVEDLRYFICLNLGDVYNRMNISDSSYHYFTQSFELANKLQDIDLIASALTGLGHSYRKIGRYNESLSNYHSAIAGLRAANDDEILCEALLGLANLQELLNNRDSAAFYAYESVAIAKKDKFLTDELAAASFLTNLYKSDRKTDSAFAYVTRVQELNDSINSKARIRESQILSTNEQLRQLEIEENKKIAAIERHQQLQLLFIGIFIPGFFLFTLLLSRIRLHIRIIKVLGILSLLVLFEYLTLLLHPYVLEFTGHTPVYEILIFVAIAAILIPAHHRIEHWLVDRLTRRGAQPGTIKLVTKKIKMQDPSA